MSEQNGAVERGADLAIPETLHPVAIGRTPVLDFSGASLMDKWKMAEMLATSDLVPKDFKGKPANILIAADIGVSIGMSPAQALQCIAVINGKPAIYGDGLIGLVRGSGKCEWIEEVEVGKPGTDDYGFTCSSKRVGQPKIVSNTFTIRDAKTAKLWGKTGRDGQDTPWITHPNRMLKMRARGFTCRDLYADILKGLTMAEEVVDIPSEVRDAIVNAKSRTEAVKIALAAKTAMAAAGVADRQADAPSNAPATVTNDAAPAEADALPDVSTLKGSDIRELVQGEAQKHGVQPWELSAIEKATDKGRLSRDNAQQVIRAIRDFKDSKAQATDDVSATKAVGELVEDDEHVAAPV